MSAFPLIFLPPFLLQAALLLIDISIKAFAGITPSLMVTEAFLGGESL
jgi:hypothetical protein